MYSIFKYVQSKEKEKDVLFSTCIIPWAVASENIFKEEEKFDVTVR
jgi:hypothetical protein